MRYATQALALPRTSSVSFLSPSSRLFTDYQPYNSYRVTFDKTTMDIFDHRYYRLSKYLIWSVGNWPYQPLNQRRILSVFMYLSLTTVMLVQALKLVQVWGNIDIMVECVVPMGVQFVAILKASNCISNAVKMRKLLDLMKEDWARLTDKQEMKILMSYVGQGFVMSTLYGGSVIGSLVLYLLIPMLPQILDIVLPLNESRPRQFLYQTEYYVDPYEYYVPIMVHDYIGTTVAVLIIVGADMVLMGYIYHVCGMFSIIGRRLENTMKGEDIDVILEWNTESEEIYQRIAICIKAHAQVIDFANLIEAAHSLTFLFQIGTSMILVSATGLQFITKLGSYDEAFRLGQFIIGQLFHLFFNSLSGQVLVNHTEQFRDSIYFAEWYRFPLRCRHLLRVAMMRSLKPCKMTAGKIYDMSMESFATVIQTSMSYFTVLVSMR